jgi:hypothetical protein
MKPTDLLTTLVLLASMVCLGPSLRAAQNKAQNKEQWAAIRVFVFAGSNPSGFVDPGHKDLTDSIADLKKALAQKKVITVVDEGEGADVMVEVTGRGYRESGGTTTYKTPLGQYATSKDMVATVRVTISAGDYSTTIDGLNDGRITNVWRTAANSAARQIEAWVRDNRDKLLARRTK